MTVVRVGILIYPTADKSQNNRISIENICNGNDLKLTDVSQNHNSKV